MILPDGPKKHPIQKVLHFFMLFFVFLILATTALLGVQWFSSSVDGLFSSGLGYDKSLFSADIQASAANQSFQNLELEPKISMPAVEILESETTPKVETPPKNTATIEASSAFSMVVASGQQSVLFSQNAQRRLPVASLTKLMTAMVALENYNLDQLVQISPAAMAQEGEQGDLKLSETLSVKSLLYVMLMDSSNRAAYALSEVMGKDKFIDAMNEDALALGLENTHFDDSTGLSSTSYSTAYDLAILSQYLFDNYPLFRQMIGLKSFDLYVNGRFHHKVINTNKLLGSYNIIGGKTGFTNEAKGCFMVIQKTPLNDNYVINIILGADDRFLEMEKLINFAGT